jgi:hypothetical protein
MFSESGQPLKLPITYVHYRSNGEGGVHLHHFLCIYARLIRPRE